MEKQLKERIFGAVVIVSLMVIFVPMLLNPDEDESNILSDSLPLKPNMQSKAVEMGAPESVLALQHQREVTQQATKATNTAAKAKSTPQKATTKVAAKKTGDDLEVLVDKIQKTQKKSTTKAKATDKAWVVQLATFKDERNAKNLVKDLHAKGYTAYARESHGQTQDFTRVLVGPEPDRERAEKLKSTLNAAYKTDGLIVPFVS